MNDKNFMLYRASAGSGKTYTLVREFLTLCLSSDNVTYNNKEDMAYKAYSEYLKNFYENQ